jgi:polysaccharide biosynthesis protein PslG
MAGRATIVRRALIRAAVAIRQELTNRRASQARVSTDFAVREPLAQAPVSPRKPAHASCRQANQQSSSTRVDQVASSVQWVARRLIGLSALMLPVMAGPSSTFAEPRAEFRSTAPLSAAPQRLPDAQHPKFPPLVVGHNFGVNVHGATEADLDMIAATGLKFVRIDLTWEVTERSPGVYDFAPYDVMARQLKARGLRPLFILNYSNPLYAKQVALRQKGPTVKKASAPVLPKAVAAFARWAAHAVSRFHEYDAVFELWNEPDLDHFWPPQSNVQHYVALANAACRAIREAVPEATIIGPAAAKPPTQSRPSTPFLNAVLSSGVLGCLDGVSVHPYSHIPDLKYTARNWDLLRRSIAQFGRTSEARGSHANRSPKEAFAGSAGTSNQVRPLPVPINSESGLTTGGGTLLHRPPDEAAQALYVVRMMLLDFESGVPISIWYDWRDDGDDPSEPENRFGLVRRDLSPKPAYRALKMLLGELSGFSLECSKRDEDGQLILVFGRANANAKLVSWHEGSGSARLELRPPVRVARAKDMYGSPIAVPHAGGAARAEAANILYVELESQDARAVCGQLQQVPARKQ